MKVLENWDINLRRSFISKNMLYEHIKIDLVKKVKSFGTCSLVRQKAIETFGFMFFGNEVKYFKKM